MNGFVWHGALLNDRARKYLQVEPERVGLVAPLWQEAHDLVRPAAWWQVLDLAEFQEAFAPHAAASRALSRHLEGAGQVALMAVSLGAELEAAAKRCLNEGEVFRGYILDRAGSYLAEHQMAALDNHLEDLLGGQGRRLTGRYSPGYQDFPLAAQRAFLRLAGPAMPGLCLGPGDLLQPEKSVTALKGVVPA